LDLKAGSTATVSNNVNKEDADVAVEVNITSNQNIQVEVEVAEYEMDDDGNILKKIESSSFESSASIRDSSRKNLKRLEALYSENEQVGSPIQRTEEKFCAEDHHQNGSRPLKKFSKLAALADNINSWEDDYSRHEAHAPTVKGAIPKTQSQIHIQSKSGQDNRHGSPLKNLMWDRKVIDSLEAQGYTRRDSVVPKLVYEYKDKPTTSQTFVPKSTVSPAKNIIVGSPGKTAAGSPSKLATSGSPAKPYQSPVKSYQSPVKPYRSPAKVSSPAKVKTPQKTIMKPQATSKPTTPSKSVSFSNSVKGQKDPAEMSLKERMAIFEKNKGVAPLPKCRFGLAETTTYNAGEGTSKSVLGDLSDKISNFQVHAAEKKKESGVVQDTGASVKGMASILLGKKEMTISEKQISEEIRKQKELDMQTVLNRFQVPPQPQQSQEPEKPKDPKSPRKMEVDDDVELRNKKRRSTEQKQTPEKLRNQEAFQRSDDKKRARVSASRLYPVLSDIESTTDSEMDNYTTATVSGTESAQEGAYHIYSESSTRVCTTNDEDQNDSYEEYSEEEETNLSLGREILKSVKESQENTVSFFNVFFLALQKINFLFEISAKSLLPGQHC
jgi:actin-binding protein anillin